MHFLNERRESVRGENPEITFSELSKKLAAEWSALPEEEKLKYNEFAKKDKDRSVVRCLCQNNDSHLQIRQRVC